MRCRPFEHEVAPAQADSLGDPQAGRGEQLEQRPPLRWDLIEEADELGPGEEASLARRPGTTRAPARQHDLLGWVDVEQSLGDRRVQRQAQRREHVPDRPITQSPVAPGAGRQPIDEVLHGETIEIADPDLAVEVGQREGDQQPAVLTARVRAHAVVPEPA